MAGFVVVVVAAAAVVAAAERVTSEHVQTYPSAASWIFFATPRRRAAKPLGVTVRHMTIQHFAVLNDALEGCKDIEGLRLGFVGAEDFVQGNR